ncbi:MAG TPA: class I SAM-dependent methyltransferase [Solirubrobacteraceae bacterium]|nr:class I SAM-dependent methyltransferase [Solirubrobacteraceae bacterium]
MGTDPDSWLLDELSTAGREHFDSDHARRYDGKEDAGAAEELALLERLGVAGPGCCVVDIGTGTGQFAFAAVAVCERVVAVDVSPVMLGRFREKAAASGADNLEVVEAGFLSYRHTGAPADAVYSRLALHHLPDFWKAVALTRIAAMLRPGGIFRLSDVVYSFAPDEAEERIESWIATTMSADVHDGWTRAELAEHVRDENSTFSWLLEPMIERAGLKIFDAEYSDDRMMARYVCRR